MKLKKFARLRPHALALGVFLGRAAQADTVIDFNADPTTCVPPQVENPNAPPGITNFANFAAASSPGITVTGFGTPNIGVKWGGIPSPDTRWEYYNDGGYRWAGVQLQGASIGSTEKLTFVPNNPGAAVTVKSFNFHPYYFFTGTGGGLLEKGERFTFDVSVVSGTNVLSGPVHVTFQTDATKNHPVSLNYTGAPGQTLKLKITRVASVLAANESEGNGFDIAVDDIAFAQTPATSFPAGPQVVSVSPADDTKGIAATAVVPYAATIADGANTLSNSTIQLRLDGNLVSPPPTVTPLGGGQTSVSYPGVAGFFSSGPHVYKLTYSDNLGGNYTHETVFNTDYTTLPASYALPPDAGVVRGFTLRSVSASTQATDMRATIARAIAQLNGTLTNPATSLPYTNDATLGTNSDGSFNVDTVLNFSDGGIDSGDFPGDASFPGLDAPPYDFFSTESILRLNLQAGYYRLGVTSDDGFQVSAIPPQGVAGSPIVAGLFDGARGAASTLFDVLATNSGIYTFKLIYFDDRLAANCEFYSVTNIASGGKLLINDTAPDAIKSFRVLKPRITSIAKSGANVNVNWAYGTPPYQVQIKTNITDASWSNFGSATSNSTASIPMQSATLFIRVCYVQP